jgi:hypothetical protein
MMFNANSLAFDANYSNLENYTFNAIYSNLENYACGLPINKNCTHALHVGRRSTNKLRLVDYELRLVTLIPCALFWASKCTPSHAYDLVLGCSLNHVQCVQSFALVRQIQLE